MKKILIFGLLIVLATCSCLVGCEEEPWTPSISIEHAFTYEVTGTAICADIKYKSVWVGTPRYYEEPNTFLPWNKELVYWEPSDIGTSYYLSARKLESDIFGEVIVSVYIDSVLEKTEKTSDPFGFVAVYGTTP